MQKPTRKLGADESIRLDTAIPQADLIQGVFPSTLVEPSAEYPPIDTADNWQQIYSYLGYLNHARHKRARLWS